jgi:spore coat polysaccharide biosynthesis protein SpsF (cytidylyltransferase family)
MKPENTIKFPKELRLTLDYPEDLNLAKKVISNLGNNFNLKDIIRLFEKNPQFLQITNNLEERYKQHWDQNVADTQLKDIHID